MEIKDKLQLQWSLIESGKEHFKNKNYTSALSVFQELLNLDPENKEILFEIGKTYFVLQEYHLAIDFLLKAKQKAPDYEHIYLLLAKSFTNIGSYAQAIGQLTELKEIGSYTCKIEEELRAVNRERYERLTDICEFRQELKSTIEQYKERLKKNPLDEKAITYLVQIYNFKGEYDLTQDIANPSLEHIPEDNVFLKNKILNELEIAQGKTILTSKVRALNVTLSRRCNLSCIMCLPPAYPWEIPQRTLKEIYGLFPYLEKIIWQGGEVFVLDYFEELITEASRYPNIRQLIVTNAQIIDERLAEKMVKGNIELTVSVDGTTKETYEYIRRGASFETLIRNLKLISHLKEQYKSNMILNLNVAVMKSNYRQLESFIDFAKEFGFNFICFMPIEIRIKKNINAAEDIFIHNKDTQALNFITKRISILEQKAKLYGIRLENRLLSLTEHSRLHIESAGKRNPEETTCKTTSSKKMLCHLPWQQMLIDYDGFVRPDCQCNWERNAGSLLDNLSLGDIWNNHVMQGYRKAILNHDYHNLCSHACIEGKILETHLKIP